MSEDLKTSIASFYANRDEDRRSFYRHYFTQAETEFFRKHKLLATVKPAIEEVTNVREKYSSKISHRTRRDYPNRLISYLHAVLLSLIPNSCRLTKLQTKYPDTYSDKSLIGPEMIMTAPNLSNHAYLKALCLRAYIKENSKQYLTSLEGLVNAASELESLSLSVWMTGEPYTNEKKAITPKASVSTVISMMLEMRNIQNVRILASVIAIVSRAKKLRKVSLTLHSSPERGSSILDKLVSNNEHCTEIIKLRQQFDSKTDENYGKSLNLKGDPGFQDLIASLEKLLQCPAIEELSVDLQLLRDVLIMEIVGFICNKIQSNGLNSLTVNVNVSSIEQRNYNDLQKIVWGSNIHLIRGSVE